MVRSSGGERIVGCSAGMNFEETKLEYDKR